MQEVLISFNTAKLAAEIGFEEWCSSAYFIYKQLGMALDIPKGTAMKDTYFAPTQSLLQKWLREKHKIDCLVSQDWDKGDFLGYECTVEKLDTSINTDTFKTYEEALETGLQTVLEFLKYNKQFNNG